MENLHHTIGNISQDIVRWMRKIAKIDSSRRKEMPKGNPRENDISPIDKDNEEINRKVKRSQFCCCLNNGRSL